MDFLRNETLLSHFQDLIEGIDEEPTDEPDLSTIDPATMDIQDMIQLLSDSNINGNDNNQLQTSRNRNKTDNKELLLLLQQKPLNATTLNPSTLKSELEKRNIPPRGFFYDDAKHLQECLDREHEEYIEEKKREWIEALVATRKERIEKRRWEWMEKEMEEERTEIMERDERVRDWLELQFRLREMRMKEEQMKKETKQCEKRKEEESMMAAVAPRNYRINVNAFSARSLAKFLWSDTWILSIDVSNMNLPDSAGAYLCRALKGNSTLIKYELGGNEFSSKTCKSLAESLEVNGTFSSMNLEGNPLVVDEEGKESFEMLSRSLAKNSGLVFLSLWMCGVGVEGGRALARNIVENTTLVSLEVGYNNFDNSDVMVLRKQLELNRTKRTKKLAKEAENANQARKKEEEHIKSLMEMEKKESEEKWLQEQKIVRANERRLEMERQQEEAALERQKKKQMERAVRLEEARVQEKLKKSKKGKKGKKGKK